MAQQAFAPIQLNGGEGFPPNEDDSGALIGSAAEVTKVRIARAFSSAERSADEAFERVGSSAF